MPVASPLYRMADRLADGHLDTVLARLQAEGLSADSIAARLYAEHGIEASRPTIVAWLAGLPAPAEAGDAA